MFTYVRMEYVLKLFFVLIKDLSSKIILGNPFMALLYPLLTTAEGIKTNVLRKDILFKIHLTTYLKRNLFTR